MTTANKNGQLALFQFSTPAPGVAKFLTTRNLEKNNMVVGMTLTPAKRKDLAKALDLSPKKDSAKLDAEMLKVSDELKSTLAREFAGYASSSDFTGGRLSIRRNKEGLVTITASVKQVKRQANGPSDEDVAKLLGLTVDEVKELRLAREKAEMPVDIGSVPENAMAAQSDSK